MPEHGAGPPGDESGIRPEVVQAIFSALVDMDPGKLAPLEANGIRITPAEGKQADELYLAACSRAAVSGKRWLEAMQVLIGDRKFSEPSLARPGRRPQPGTGLTAAGAPMRTNGRKSGASG